MNIYTYKDKKIALCEGKGCIHRYRCYRHSLYQDAIFKGMKYMKVNENTCMNPEDNTPGYQYMWLPEVI